MLNIVTSFVKSATKTSDMMLRVHVEDNNGVPFERGYDHIIEGMSSANKYVDELVKLFDERTLKYTFRMEWFTTTKEN